MHWMLLARLRCVETLASRTPKGMNYLIGINRLFDDDCEKCGKLYIK